MEVNYMKKILFTMMILFGISAFSSNSYETDLVGRMKVLEEKVQVKLDSGVTAEMHEGIAELSEAWEKELNTVVSVIYDFTELFPDVWVYAEGSTPSRTRLYQMKIVKYFDIVMRDFHLLCLLNGEWEEFRPKVNYEGFAIKRK